MERRQAGAAPLGHDDDDRRGGGGIWKLLLPLLLLVALIVALLVIGRNDDDSKSKSSKSSSKPSSSATVKPSSGATVKAGSTALLPVKAGVLKPLVGQDATGKGLKVVAVNPKDGFWVGNSLQDRLYVEFGGKTGEDESGTLPAKGDTVTLDAEVRPSPVEPASALHIEKGDAGLIKKAGGFLNARSVQTTS